MKPKLIDPKDAAAKLLDEKTLWDIWCASCRIPRPVRNHVYRLGGLAAVACYAFLLPHSDASLVKTARTIIGLAFPAMLGLLGFLLAGLTIFVSGERRDILVAMAHWEDGDSGLSVLKVNLLAFVRPLIELLIISFIMLVAMVIAEPSGTPIAWVAQHGTGKALYLTSRIGFVGVAFFTLCGFVAVKSSIRNVYHLIMTSVRWEMGQDIANHDKAGDAVAPASKPEE
jgi:hypothetical protein